MTSGKDEGIVGSATIKTRMARHTVTTLNGEEVELLHLREKEYYEKALAAYQDQYSFTMANDLRTLDRLLLMEVQMLRYQWYTMAGSDYEGIDLEAKEEEALRKAMKEISSQINETQSLLGLSKAERDKKSVDSVGGYIVQLQQAAKHHGVMREKQLGRALELTKELFSLVNAFNRSNEQERRKLGFDGPEDILTWITDFMAPEFNAIDEHFRQNTARFYRRSL